MKPRANIYDFDRSFFLHLHSRHLWLAKCTTKFGKSDKLANFASIFKCHTILEMADQALQLLLKIKKLSNRHNELEANK